MVGRGSFKESKLGGSETRRDGRLYIERGGRCSGTDYLGILSTRDVRGLCLFALTDGIAI